MTSRHGRVRVSGEVVSLHPRSHADGAWQRGVLRTEYGAQLVFVATAIRPLKPGTSVEVAGAMEVHRMHGDQLRVLECLRVDLPVTPEGIRRFIIDSVPGIGVARAATIARSPLLGRDKIASLDADPSRLQVLFPGRVGRQLTRAWESAQRVRAEDTRAADLALRLRSADVSHRMVRRVLAFFRTADVAEILLLKHPYRLLEIPGLGWARADRIARKLGIAPTHPARQAAAVRHALEEAAAAGHSALPTPELTTRVGELLGDRGAAISAVPTALGSGVVIEDGELIYLPQALQAEWTVASRIRRHLAAMHALTPAAGERVDAVLSSSTLTPAQVDAVRQALTTGFFVLTGGPGTGKTTTVKTLVACAIALGLRVRITAPTGKAAARAGAVAGVPADTVHRLLGGPPGGRRQTAVDADMLILDEASMCSLEVFAWLLSNLRPTTRVVVVGDADQLPSVDHGAVLRDLLASGRIPSARLIEPHRQAAKSGIIANAHRVLAGQDLLTGFEDFLFADVARTRGGTTGVERAVQRLDAALGWLTETMGMDAVRDVQVLSPTKGGPLGVAVLNERLQARFNRDGQAGPLIGGGHRVRVGDRVIQVRNDYTLGPSGVFNGEQGIVVSVGPDRLNVAFDGNREAEAVGFRRFNLRLAWAGTVHRAQGSEFPAVVAIYHRSHGAMLNTHLLYTAITRARQRFILIGDEEALRVGRLRIGGRTSSRQTGLTRHLATLPYVGG